MWIRLDFAATLCQPTSGTNIFHTPILNTMPRGTGHVFRKRALLLLAVPCSVLPWSPVWALCNGGATVTSTLTISTSCANGGVKPLGLDTGANLTINAGVTVSNDAGGGRNGDPISVLSSATASTLTNNGTISTGQQWGVTVNGTLNSLVNTGRISSNVRRGIVINGVAGKIGVLTNTGAIIGPFAGVTNNSGGLLQTFNNLQGAGHANGAVTYTGELPTSYNIIINSPGTYGRLGGVGVTGSMGFGIYGTSTVAIGSYTGVLSGLTTSNLTGATSGTFGGLNWALNLAPGSTTLWDLIFSAGSTNMTAGSSYTLADVGVSANPVFDGGTLTLLAGASSGQGFTVNAAGGTFTSPTNGSAQLSGLVSGAGGLTVNGTGTLMLTGNNSYSGGTTVNSGTLIVGGSSPLGTGPVVVAAAGTLMGTGTIRGPLTVAGTLKPGNSPGFLAVNATVTMNGGSTYLQDIAGTVQASRASPVGATGYYSFLNITGGQFVIQPNAILTPRLSGLFTPGESGFGSMPYTPVLGDRFRMVTADGGISGRFSTLTQPSELAAGAQFVQFYNVAGSNSLDLAVIPTSYTTLVAQNYNARSVAGALDSIVRANQGGSATDLQDQLLYAASGQNATSLPAFVRALVGEVYGATLATVPQTTLRMQQSVMSHLAGASPSTVDSASRLATGTRGVLPASAGGDQNPSIHLGYSADGTNKAAPAQGPAWGEIVYQLGSRPGDEQASGFSNNLYQLVLGADAYAARGVTIGGGLALSNTAVSAAQEQGTVQQSSLFVYAQLPVEAFVVDAMASVGLHSADHSRADPTGFTASLGTKVHGRDTLVSAGVSRPMETDGTRLTPYARLSWQQVRQSSLNEGPSAAALNVSSFDEQGLRAVVGLTVGSRNLDPLKKDGTHRFTVALGADTPKLINPMLNASLAGMPTTILTPRTGAGFVQAGYEGATRLASHVFAYVGVSSEVRRGSVQGSVNAGVRVQF